MPDAGVAPCSSCSLSGVPPRLAFRVGGRRPREPGAAPPTGRASAIRPPTSAFALGSDPLGVAGPALARVASQPRHRPTGHCPDLASPRLQALLAVEVPADRRRPSEGRCRDSPPDPTDDHENPTWG